VRARALGASGEPAAEILRAASAVGADLISIGLHPRLGCARLGFPGVAERVIRGAAVPVLVDRRAA
jgi:nucleotide-binding universal stress UspA family protein